MIYTLLHIHPSVDTFALELELMQDEDLFDRWVDVTSRSSYGTHPSHIHSPLSCTLMITSLAHPSHVLSCIQIDDRLSWLGVFSERHPPFISTYHHTSRTPLTHHHTHLSFSLSFISLQRLSRLGVFSERHTQEIVYQLVEAVLSCNRHGIAHR